MTGAPTSLLDRIRPEDIHAAPFPHLVVREVLPREACAALLEAFPSTRAIAGDREKTSNQRFSLSVSAARATEQVAPIWRGLAEEHVGQDFLDQLVRLFDGHIRRVHPTFERRFHALPSLRAGVRGIHDFHEADVLLDAQICVNTPVYGQPSSVRGPHVDLPNKLFVGLFYLRHPEDRSEGGDLQLFARRPGARGRFVGQFCSGDAYRPFETVRYASNVLVLFLNSIESVHGVTARAITPWPRLFLNLLGEVRRPVFSLAARQESLADRWIQRVWWKAVTT